MDPFEVTMGPDDADNPKAWSRPYRWYITMLSGVLVLNAYVFIFVFSRAGPDSSSLQNVRLLRPIGHHPPID